MGGSFDRVEKTLNLNVERYIDFPYQDILLTYLCVHMHGKFSNKRNNMLSLHGLKETQFMALMALESQGDGKLRSTELSGFLGVSCANVTRIVNELEKRGWVERFPDIADRRCFNLSLTKKGGNFLERLLPQHHNEFKQFWATLSNNEKDLFEKITRKLITKLDEEHRRKITKAN